MVYDIHTKTTYPVVFLPGFVRGAMVVRNAFQRKEIAYLYEMRNTGGGGVYS